MPLLAVGLSVALVAVSADQVTKPRRPALTLESISGRDSFHLYCASCHGKGGTGDGPIAAALKARPADLTVLARRNGGLFPRERIVAFVTGTGRPVPAHGSGEMPVWGPVFRGLDPSDIRVRQRIENVVTYLEMLQVPSTGVMDMGAQLFQTYCARCHGRSARGNGPLAEQLRRVPPDLTRFAARNGGIFPTERVRRIIDGREVASHGDREMPVWGDAFRSTHDGFASATVEARIAAIVRYLEAIQERSGD